MASSPSQSKPKALLFDIGGVCVVSPMQAILDYETSKSIPPGWVNFSISRTSPNGSWQKIERGEIPMDADFFAAFNADLRQPGLWKEHCERAAKRDKRLAERIEKDGVPPVPDIDAEWLFWEMMRISREPDRYMAPALKKLKASGQFHMAALSNTSIFPEGHAYNDAPASDPRAVFDVFVSSAHVGMRKPDPPIYKYALTKMREKWGEDLKEGDILFLDDVGGNLSTARKLGLRTLKVGLGDTKTAVKELEAITGLELLDDGQGKSKL